MILILSDNVIQFPDEYVKDIFENEFVDIYDGVNTFNNIQPRDHDDELALYINDLFPNYKVVWNFIRKSPKNQEEPNFIHTDEMMGDITVILYLNKEVPDDDGTTIYDKDNKKTFVTYSKYNRMIAFESDLPHSRNIYENFGEGDSSRLVQVMFLKKNR